MTQNEMETQFLFRNIRPEEGKTAAGIERICFPPNEACTEPRMLLRTKTMPELFLVAIHRETGKMAGFINGLATDETVFRDEFFTDIELQNPDGKNVMILGVDVLPEYRRQGLARAMMTEYRRRLRAAGKQQLLLTCLEEKVEMYRKFGFTDLGAANSQWGGECWHEMRCILSPAIDIEGAI